MTGKVLTLTAGVVLGALVSAASADEPPVYRGSAEVVGPAMLSIDGSRGLMTEVLTEVVNWALNQPGIFRIGAVCDVENIGSARVMEKAGMTREGLLRRYSVHPNVGPEPRDVFIYAIVK